MPPPSAAGRLARALVPALAVACTHSEAGGEKPAALPQPVVTFHTEAGDIPVEVEVARDPRARAKGLMYRETLPGGHGMLFVFPTEEVQHFWMKNTYLPLDMIFINAKLNVVGVVADAEPLTETSRSVDVPSIYVVEVNAGFAARMEIVPGTRVSTTRVPLSVRR